MNTNTVPLSLYIHIPWCEKKCPYCDFNSHVSTLKVDEKKYIKALLTDLDADLATFSDTIQSRPIHSIFIGGGTPSLFSGESYAFLLEQIKQRLTYTQDIEITLEANPSSSEVEKFQAFKQATINRLSIGVQSFNDCHLKSLGRAHQSKHAVAAASYAKEAGFNNFNLDIMFGLPAQDIEQCQNDIKQAIALEPTHISCYQLTIEPNTLFYHQPPIRPNDDKLWEMQQHIQTELTNHGFSQYEVSAYGKKICRHNMNYWQFGDYLGIGAGAHGKITDAQHNVVRYWKNKHPASYLKSEQKQGNAQTITRTQLPFEFMMNALRLKGGFSKKLFENRTGLNLQDIQPLLDKHQTQGLLTVSDTNICPSKRGYQLLDSMLQDYLPEHT